MGRTSIHLPDDLKQRLKEFNENNPARPMNHSAICRIALEKALKAEKNRTKKKAPKKVKSDA